MSCRAVFKTAEALVKTIKFRENPSPEELLKQLLSIRSFGLPLME